MTEWPRDCPLSWCSDREMDADDYRRHLESEHA